MFRTRRMRLDKTLFLSLKKFYNFWLVLVKPQQHIFIFWIRWIDQRNDVKYFCNWYNRQIARLWSIVDWKLQIDFQVVWIKDCIAYRPVIWNIRRIKFLISTSVFFFNEPIRMLIERNEREKNTFQFICNGCIEDEDLPRFSYRSMHKFQCLETQNALIITDLFKLFP